MLVSTSLYILLRYLVHQAARCARSGGGGACLKPHEEPTTTYTFSRSCRATPPPLTSCNQRRRLPFLLYNAHKQVADRRRRARGRADLPSSSSSPVSASHYVVNTGANHSLQATNRGRKCADIYASGILARSGAKQNRRNASASPVPSHAHLLRLTPFQPRVIP